MRTTLLMRALLGVTAASLALLSLVYGEAALTAHWAPAALPARLLWIDAAAGVVLAASASLGLARVARPGALVITTYLALWTLSYLPQVIAKPLTFEGWYSFCEALTTLVGAAIVCLRVHGAPSARALRVARAVFGLVCVFYGASHLAFAEFTASMVPAWLPDRLVLADATGIAHMAAGLALVTGVVPRLAATLEACMVSLFGLLVWVPSFFQQSRPVWAGSAQNQWSELVITTVLATSAWIVALSWRPGLTAPAARAHTTPLGQRA